MNTNEHSVIDSDISFRIDPFTRIIESDEPQKFVLMQGDHNSERFTFRIPRIIEGHDMYACNSVRVHFINSENKKKDNLYITGVDTVTDLALGDNDTVTFSWLISRNATKYEGTMKFAITFACLDGTAIKYRWGTHMYEKIAVAATITSDLSFEGEHIDVIEQWKNSLIEYLNEYVEYAVANQVDVAQIGKNKNDISNLKSKDVDIQNHIGELSSRMDSFTKLPAGSTSGDAELIDGRTDHKGKTWSNIGAHIRNLDIDNEKNENHRHVEHSTVYISNKRKPTWEPMSGSGVILHFYSPIVIRTHTYADGKEFDTAWDTAGVGLGDAMTINDDGSVDITMAGGKKAFYFDVSDCQFHVKDNGYLDENSVVLIQTGHDTIVGGKLLPQINRMRVDEIEELAKNNTANLRSERGYVYITSDNYIEVERQPNSGKLVVTVNAPINVRAKDFTKSYTWEEVCSGLSGAIIDEDNNKKCVITIADNFCLTFNFDTEKLYTRYHNNIPDGELCLIQNGWANLAGGAWLGIINRHAIMKIREEIAEETVDIDKLKTFMSLFIDTDNVESFLYFTDPHLAEGTDWEKQFDDFLNYLQKTYETTPVSFCMCGGDWIGNSDLQEDACYKLGFIDATMRTRFKKYYPVLGNHDTNYQGLLHADATPWSGRLSNNTIRNLWYREQGKAYYTFKEGLTRFYVFDCGVENEAMDEYQWEQCEWFANELLNHDDEHIALAYHMLHYNNDGNIQPITDRILAIAETFNNRNTIDVNGPGYNFALSKGRVEFGIGGHTHEDSVHTVRGITCVTTTQMREKSIPTFELCLADYDKRKLHLVRIGSGESREVDL